MILYALFAFVLTTAAEAETLPGFNGHFMNLSSYRVTKLELAGSCRYRSRLSGRMKSCGQKLVPLRVDSQGRYRTPALRFPNDAPRWDIKEGPFYSANIYARYGQAQDESAFIMDPDHIEDPLPQLKQPTLVSFKKAEVTLVAPNGMPTAAWIKENYPGGLYIDVTLLVPGTDLELSFLNLENIPRFDYIKGDKAQLGSDRDRPFLFGSIARPYAGKRIDLLVAVRVAGGGEDYVAKVRVPSVLDRDLLRRIPTIPLHEARRE